MREHLDNLFKTSLESYEVPFEPGAWDAMSQRLNQQQTPTVAKSNNGWWYAASIGMVALVAAVWGFGTTKGSETTSTATTVAANSDAPVAKETRTNKTKGTSSKIGYSTPVVVDETVNGTTESDIQTNTNTDNLVTPSENKVTPINDEPAKNNVVTPSGNDNTQANNKGVSTKVTPPVKPTVTKPTEERIKPISLPKVVCLGESIEVNNLNSSDATIISPSGKRKVAQGDKSMQFNANEAGMYVVKTGDLVQRLEVVEPDNNLSLDIPSSTNEISEGVPTIRVNINGAQSAIKWSTQGVPYDQVDKNTIILHPFKGKDFTLSVQSTDNNGCPVSSKETVHISSRYNLLASEGFDPSDSRTDVATFMPEALTVRNTPFELTIFDLNTKAVVYKTGDASNGWDGTDRRTGELVPLNSRWLWKVTLFNPMEGESSEYSGYITRQLR